MVNPLSSLVKSGGVAEQQSVVIQVVNVYLKTSMLDVADGGFNPGISFFGNNLEGAGNTEGPIDVHECRTAAQSLLCIDVVGDHGGGVMTRRPEPDEGDACG